MKMDLVVDLAIDSLRMLEKVFMLSLVLTLNPSITRGRHTLFIGVQATRSSWRTSYLDGLGFSLHSIGAQVLWILGAHRLDTHTTKAQVEDCGGCYGVGKVRASNRDHVV